MPPAWQGLGGRLRLWAFAPSCSILKVEDTSSLQREVNMTFWNKHEPQDDTAKGTAQKPDEHPEPPPQTWKHPDDGKELSELDEERPLKP